MGDRKGIGGLFDDDTVLWFIILFLLLFWGCGGRHETLGIVENC